MSAPKIVTNGNSLVTTLCLVLRCGGRVPDLEIMVCPKLRIDYRFYGCSSL